MTDTRTNTPGDEDSAEEESTCGNPCDSDHSCDECEPYWRRMVSEGYWDRERHRWTDKGWKEITK